MYHCNTFVVGLFENPALREYTAFSLNSTPSSSSLCSLYLALPNSPFLQNDRICPVVLRTFLVSIYNCGSTSAAGASLQLPPNKPLRQGLNVISEHKEAPYIHIYTVRLPPDYHRKSFSQHVSTVEDNHPASQLSLPLGGLVDPRNEGWVLFDRTSLAATACRLSTTP